MALPALIFYGHRIVEERDRISGSALDARNSVTVSELQGLLERLRKWRCQSLDEIAAPAGRRAAPAFALTFDDGYRDNLERLLPVLEREQAKAAIFVTTGFVDGHVEAFEYVLEKAAPKLEQNFSRLRSEVRRGNRDSVRKVREVLSESTTWRSVPSPQFLTPEDVASLAQHPLVTIGSHSVSHTPLRRRKPSVVWRELSASRRTLQIWTGQDIRYFAFPYGAHDAMSKAMARLAGYRRVFGTYISDSRATGFCLPRVDIRRFLDGDPRWSGILEF